MSLVLGMALKAYRRPIAVGAEDVPGHAARVLDWSGGAGHVEFQGEHWRATGPDMLPRDAQVKIIDRDGLTLVVASEGNTA